jgi:hypothetical protein
LKRPCDYPTPLPDKNQPGNFSVPTTNQSSIWHIQSNTFWNSACVLPLLHLKLKATPLCPKDRRVSSFRRGRHRLGWGAFNVIWWVTRRSGPGFMGPEIVSVCSLLIINLPEKKRNRGTTRERLFWAARSIRRQRKRFCACGYVQAYSTLSSCVSFGFDRGSCDMYTTCQIKLDFDLTSPVRLSSRIAPSVSFPASPPKQPTEARARLDPSVNYSY